MNETIRKFEALANCLHTRCEDCEFSKKDPCVPRVCTMDETEVLEATLKLLKELLKEKTDE